MSRPILNLWWNNKHIKKPFLSSSKLGVILETEIVHKQNWNLLEIVNVECWKCYSTKAFFLSAFSFTNTHDSQDSEESRRLYIELPSTTVIYYCFTGTYILTGWLLQRTHLYSWLAAGVEPGTFGFRAQVPNQ